jgi:two-component system, LuxR family, response regulator FixJ
MEVQPAVKFSPVDPMVSSSPATRETSSASAATVHVIDDDDSFRRSLMRILHTLGYRAAGYRCAGEFLLTMVTEPAGCILLDISMPGPSGIELLQAMMQRGSVAPTIFVTARDDVFTSVSAMKLGAFDYLVKPVCAERMLSVVERAMRLDAQRVAAQDALQDLCARYAELTSVERAIFAGVTTHRLNKQMAADLNACERTIKALRARMMSKLNVATVPELVRAAAMLERAGVSLARPTPEGKRIHESINSSARENSSWRPFLLHSSPTRS